MPNWEAGGQEQTPEEQMGIFKMIGAAYNAAKGAIKKS